MITFTILIKALSIQTELWNPKEPVNEGLHVAGTLQPVPSPTTQIETQTEKTRSRSLRKKRRKTKAVPQSSPFVKKNPQRKTRKMRMRGGFSWGLRFLTESWLSSWLRATSSTQEMQV